MAIVPRPGTREKTILIGTMSHAAREFDLSFQLTLPSKMVLTSFRIESWCWMWCAGHETCDSRWLYARMQNAPPPGSKRNIWVQARSRYVGRITSLRVVLLFTKYLTCWSARDNNVLCGITAAANGTVIDVFHKGGVTRKFYREHRVFLPWLQTLEATGRGKLLVWSSYASTTKEIPARKMCRSREPPQLPLG